MALNAYYGKRKVLIVGIDSTTIADDIASAMREIGFEAVNQMAAPSNYPGYYTIAEAQPEYTLFVQHSNGCYVQPCRVDGWPGERLGVYASRSIDESQCAKEHYKHPLKMLGLDPYLLGSHKLDFGEVKDLPWYWQDSSPMLYLRVPDVDGIGAAVAQAVAEYFKR